MKFYVATVVQLSEMRSSGKPAHGQRPRRSMVSNSKESLLEWLDAFPDGEFHKVGPGKWKPKRKRKRKSARQQRRNKRSPFVQRG